MKKADTRKVKVVKDDALIVAVDIGMEMNRGYCTTPDGRSSKTFKFDNTRAGMDTLWGIIMANKNRFKCNEVIVGYESTGPYGEPMLHYLMNKPVRIVQVNPMHTKRVKEINDNSPLKTDEKDPRVIADIHTVGSCIEHCHPRGRCGVFTEVEQLAGEARKRADCPCESVTAVGLSVVSRVHDRDKRYKMQDTSLPPQEISDAGDHKRFG